ncbi:integrase [Rhizobium laguerreae]|uniref:integrase n=1 Tax=Rhizobium laguerreae TaxID=1076926 RepID=UPI001C91CAA5|nr:integrase [Rhizobium laguerreae]MBY3258845.1 integrase [Rhizobium laguerreae]MBY3282014.1 integrase [Rhizobium laguerreae]MBY3293304.1 integrase [Rhizobium laguerreae]
MTDDFTQNLSEKLVSIYQRFRHRLDATAPGGKWMPYRWWTLPDPLDGIWMPYSSMLGEYATELANIINDLTNHVHRLRTWDEIISELDNDDKLAVSHEFLDTLGTVALGQPYAIKSRLAFASGHLCHQANRARQSKAWVDDFPEKNLYLNDIQPYGAGWRKFSAFKVRVEAIAGSAFKAESDDFRNAYNHGFSSRFLLGITSTVRRTVKDGKVRYEFGVNEPLEISKIAGLLEIERDLCYRAFDAFIKLVAEQTNAIASFDEE